MTIPKPPSCFGCPLQYQQGFVPATGDFKKSVLIVGEAAGEQEALAGQAFIGKAGYYLWNNLRRVGLEREDFRIHNVLSCQPPKNKLVGMPYETEAIHRCRPNLDATIAQCKREADAKGHTFTILTLGRTAFKRILGLDDRTHAKLLKLDYIAYPFYSQEYGAYVVAADHPAWLMRGNHHLISTLQFAALRAVEIARDGFTPDPEDYIIDPDPITFNGWANDYLRRIEKYDDLVLAFDIETLMKKDMDEEEIARILDPDYTILRIGFSYEYGKAVTIPWRSDYMPALQRIFASGGMKMGWNNDNYDNPRIRQHMPINGTIVDGMLGWHVLNSALPKGLGFVAPYYTKTGMWKHTSDSEAAKYNAKDAAVQWMCWQGIARDLRKEKLWGVFQTDVIDINTVFNHMSTSGVLRDEVLRNEAEQSLAKQLEEIQCQIETQVPFEAKSFKAFQRTPKSLDGLVQVAGQKKTTKRCSNCGKLDVVASHYKSVGVKKLKAGVSENPCFGAASEKIQVESSLWARPMPFKLSTKSLQKYQEVKKHRGILKPNKAQGTSTITFDEKAIMRLMMRYPNDQLYPLIGQYRRVQKLLGTYVGVTNDDGVVVGGLPVGRDGMIHTTFTHNPSTLRSASQRPNLQNLPRPGKPGDNATIIRNLIKARDGHVFLARDYAGIEAVLTGYLAGARDYVRLALHDVHSFYTAYALHELDPERISANDLPQLSWDDDKLFTRLAEIKKEFKEDRNSLYKHLVHGANFMQQAKGAAEKIYLETGLLYETSLVHRVMEIYFDLFPAIREWHKQTLAMADKDGYIRNPFNYVHRFYRVFGWEKIGDLWQQTQGPDAPAVIAFGPQSTAAAIIKAAMRRLYFNRFEECGQYLRLLVHDELFAEVPEAKVSEVDAVLKEEMERPIEALPLPPDWNMGEYLVINTEGKQGDRWGSMS